MRITYADIALCDWHTPASDLLVDGQPMVEVLPLAGAAYQRIYTRGNRLTTISFAVSREHASLRDAQRWCMGFAESLPARADAELTVGYGADTELVSLPACSARVQVRLFGVRTIEQFTVIAPRVVLEGPIINTNVSMIISRRVAIPNGATTVNIVFPAEFADAPVVTATVEKPNASGDNIWATVLADSVTRAGGTVDLSGPVPALGYYLAWSAIG